MKRLDPILDDPRVTFEAIYSTILSDKDTKECRRLNRLRRRVRCAYRWYNRHKPDLHKLPAFKLILCDRDVRKQALLQCYEGAKMEVRPVRPLNRMYKQIRELTYTCPYCTLARTETLDHYLKKDRYPEFSVLSSNLIPSCRGCNPDRDFRNKRGERALIHPYFDSIPDERLLVATVRIVQNDPKVNFDMDFSRCKDADFAELYKRHFILLRLQERYRKEAEEDRIHSILALLKVHGSRGLSRNEARALLIEQADEEEKRLGPNSFLVALYRGAASSDEFLDYGLRGRK